MPKALSWESERNQIVADFLQYWDSERLFASWVKEVGEFGIDPTKVIHEVRIAHPSWAGKDIRCPGGQPLVEWWPKGSVEGRTLAIREYLTTPGNSTLPVYLVRCFDLKGPRYTIEHLIGAGGDVEAIAATFLSASLFYRMGSSRRSYPRDEWPHFYAVDEVRKWARERSGSHWDTTCTSTLPHHEDTYGLHIRNVDQLVKFLAAEHARNLHQFTPVRIVQAIWTDGTYVGRAPLNFEVFSGFAFKYRPQPKDLASAAVDAIQSCHVLTTSGPGTGKPADVSKVQAIRAAVGTHRVALASGVDVYNVGTFLPYVDDFLVATSINKTFSEIDEGKARELADEIHSYGQVHSGWAPV